MKIGTRIARTIYVKKKKAALRDKCEIIVNYIYGFTVEDATTVRRDRRGEERRIIHALEKRIVYFIIVVANPPSTNIKRVIIVFIMYRMYIYIKYVLYIISTRVARRIIII